MRIVNVELPFTTEALDGIKHEGRPFVYEALKAVPGFVGVEGRKEPFSSEWKWKHFDQRNKARGSWTMTFASDKALLTGEITGLGPEDYVKSKVQTALIDAHMKVTMARRAQEAEAAAQVSA